MNRFPVYAFVLILTSIFYLGCNHDVSPRVVPESYFIDYFFYGSDSLPIKDTLLFSSTDTYTKSTTVRKTGESRVTTYWEYFIAVQEIEALNIAISLAVTTKKGDTLLDTTLYWNQLMKTEPKYINNSVIKPKFYLPYPAIKQQKY